MNKKAFHEYLSGSLGGIPDDWNISTAAMPFASPSPAAYVR